MENQEIIIPLEEYKALRDICEDYQKLIGEYNILLMQYKILENNAKSKVKTKIGFV